jgi:hypothetical protein
MEQERNDVKNAVDKMAEGYQLHIDEIQRLRTSFRALISEVNKYAKDPHEHELPDARQWLMEIYPNED